MHEDILPETFLKLQYPEAAERKKAEEVEVQERQFIAAVDKVVPSISMTELMRYEELKAKFSASWWVLIS